MCGMSTIQYSARSARLAVYSCIRCSLSRDSRVDRHWLPATDCCQRYLPCRQPAFDVAKKLGISCRECTGQGNDYELIPTVKMETRHPVVGSLGNEFPSIYNHCGFMAASSRKTFEKKNHFCVFGKKTTLYGKIYKILFWNDSSPHRSTCCVQISWNLANGKSIQETQLSLRDRATRACQLKSGKVLHKCRRLVFEKLWN